MNPFPRTWIDVDLGAIRDNLGWLRGRLPEGVKVALVAKADAYGHGLVPVGRYAAENGADWLCVATVQEGLSLRDAGVESPILVLSPILPVEAEQAVFYDLRITLERAETARAVSEAAAGQNRIAKVHLEVDTGLARFGAMPDEVLDLARQIAADPHLELEGVCQHFIDSGNDPDTTALQMGLFRAVLDAVQDGGVELPMVHAANSAGATLRRDATFDLVRIGILAYGVDPYKMAGGALRPVMRWRTRVTALRQIPTGAGVSYCSTHRVSRPSVIATLGVGYGDGYPRSLSSKGKVLVRGQEADVVGLVCMDQVLIDATDVAGIEIGDEVELIGPTITVERLAGWASTNVHEIVTRIMSRVPRRYLR